MKYRKMILIIIIISIYTGQILLNCILQTHHGHTHACTDARTHAHTSPPPSLWMGRCAPFMMELTPPFRRWRDNDRSVLHSNKQRAGDSEFAIVFFFSCLKKSRPNWDANSWKDMLSVDTNNLRHLPRRSSKNCDLQFANTDRPTDRHTDIRTDGRTDGRTENYSIDVSKDW